MFPLLPVAPLPQVDFPTIQVSANLPGASPETMASNVAQPLERQFSLIAGLSQMTSTSGIGSTQITLQFDLNRAIDAAALDVQAAINAVDRPAAGQPAEPADLPQDQPGRLADHDPGGAVEDAAADRGQRLRRQHPGAADLADRGRRPGQHRRRAEARGARAGRSGQARRAGHEPGGRARACIANVTVNQPKGTIDGPTQSFTVYTNDQLLKAAPWNDVVLAYRNGAPIRVRDIGVAVDAPGEHQDRRLGLRRRRARPSSSIENGRGILLVDHQAAGRQRDRDGRRASRPRCRGCRRRSRRRSTVNTLIDRTQTIRASVHDVEFTLMLTIALVVLVIFVFLRNVPATLIPSVTVPLALLGTAAVMYLLGYSLDNLSLMALTIAVGFVVDDAIVMLENIYRHVEEGMAPMEAALKGAGEIGFTIISISVSLVAVFIPLLLMGGIVGRLFREFAVTVTLTIGVSVIDLADADADAVLALPEERARDAARPALPAVRARLRRDARRLQARPATSCCGTSSSR